MSNSISVIIVNHNGHDLLADCFASLAAQTELPAEIILVDNASADDSVAYVRANYKEVRIISSSHNSGFAGGNNLGVDAATGDYFFLLNSDARPAPHCLAALRASLERDASRGAAVPKIVLDQHPHIVEQAGTYYNQLGHCWTRGFQEVDYGQYDRPEQVPGLTGCACLLRRSALGDTPPFDATFFMYYEELDLTLRLRSEGWTIWYEPHAVVRHQSMASFNRSFHEPTLWQQQLCNRNRLAVWFTYYPIGLTQLT